MLTPSRAWASRPLESKRSAQASAEPQGGNDGSPQGARRQKPARCQARQRGPARPGDAKKICTGSSDYPNQSMAHSLDRRTKTRMAKVMPALGSRYPTAAALPIYIRLGGAAALHGHPLLHCLEMGGFAPLACQLFSRFISSASIHSARLILTFWSMPWMARVRFLRPLAVRADSPP